LYYDLYESTVTVFDGLNMDIRKGEPHTVHTLKVYGIKPLDVTYKSLMTTLTVKDRNNRDKITRVMELTFKSELNPDQAWPDWTVCNDPNIRQVDGINCGPIACLKVMELFGILEPGLMSAIAESCKGYRPVVMDYYQQCISKYKNDIFLELRKLKVAKAQATTQAQATSHDDGGDVKYLGLQKGNSDEDKDYTTVRNGAEPGMVVTLKVDYRTHSHAQGLIGVVFGVKPTGGIKVCCEHGIITHSGGPGVYWVPVDKYVVKAKVHKFIPLTDALYAVQNMVLDGNFDEAKAPTISYSKLHEIMIGATSPAKKAPGCKCKNGKCGNQCGCRRKGVSCHSGCSCNGNCCQSVKMGGLGTKTT
jgi:hypothetical protein